MPLDTSRVPKHVAIIMDGNGRWAQRRGRPRVFGHIRGSSQVKPILKEAARLGVEVLTLYAFSTENWKRPQSELNVLWRLLCKFLDRELEELNREGVRLCVLGEPDRLPKFVQESLGRSIEKLSKNNRIILNLALSYGGRDEIVKAARSVAQKAVLLKMDPGALTEALFEQELFTAFLGDRSNVDLLIRTSGEQRVSGFLLWQCAYAEFYFSDLCWPEFGPEQLQEALSVFEKRDRRFGGIQIKS